MTVAVARLGSLTFSGPWKYHGLVRKMDHGPYSRRPICSMRRNDR